jgi:fibronectin type 3 domain-containing protein
MNTLMGTGSTRRLPGARSFHLALSALAAASLAACGGDSGSSLTASPGSVHNPQLTTPIKFVQVAYATPQSNSATITVKFPAAQAAGDLNVIAVGWNDTTATVTSVTDTKGNSYTRAVGPTTNPRLLTQSIYYARNIAAAAAGANSVTVRFNVPAVYVDVRILEYSGLDPAAPLDATAAAWGSSANNDSGPLTTTGANELLFAANMTTGWTNGPGTGFTSRVITSPDGDIAEDRVAASAGIYRGTAPGAGAWVMQMVAFRSTPVQPPTAPGNLTATATSSIKVDLGWTASTSSQGIAGYRVERCQGTGCTSFTQIAAPTGTTYADTTCAPNTAYSYRVRAADTAGNLSAYSNVAGATTPADTQPPTTPVNLAATAASSSQINVSWAASTDNVAVTGYFLERCQNAGCTDFAQIATPTGTGYSDTGLLASTSYSYRVRAADAAGNPSGYSTPASATTLAVAQPPTPPSNLVATAVSASQINLAWTASTSSGGVAGYLVERCQGAGCTSFAQIATPAGNSYSDGGLLASTSYTYRVRATDAAGNLSDYSNNATATTFAPSSSTPTLVQHTASSSNEQNGLTGNDYKFTLPNKVLPGNCLILAVTFGSNPFSPTTAITAITDSSGDTWSSTPDVTTTDGGTAFSQIFVHPNASAGIHTITVTLNRVVTLFQYTVSEFYNVAAVTPVNGRAGRAIAANGTISTGSFTPANNDAAGGNLIWAYFADDSAPFATMPTALAAGGSFTLLDASIGTNSAALPHASMYFVQTTAAAINPSMTLTGGGSDTWNGVAVALKAASAGVAPAASGIRIVSLVHETNSAPPATWIVQFPSRGDLIVLRVNDDPNLTSITDSSGNAYVRSTTSPQIWHADHPITGPNLKLTLHFTATPQNRTILLYDIIGASAAPEDGHVQNQAGAAPSTSAAYDLPDSPAITPASANGLTIAALTMGIGPVDGFAAGAPSGAIYDFVFHTGDVDSDRMDSGDGAAHFYNPDLSTEHWNWHVPNAAGVSSNSLFVGSAAHFK